MAEIVSGAELATLVHALPCENHRHRQTRRLEV
jgi:hypothetical protein